MIIAKFDTAKLSMVYLSTKKISRIRLQKKLDKAKRKWIKMNHRSKRWYMLGLKIKPSASTKAARDVCSSGS